jgi:hypothetical protein
MFGSEHREIQPDIEIHEQPTHRVSGVLSGNGVYAVIEGADIPNGAAVVKPGDTVGEYRVAAITPDAVTLKRVVNVGQGNQTYTQTVPLSDSSSTPTASFSGPGNFAPTLPGRMGVPGGFPGRFPGGRRGGGAAIGGGE